VEKDTHTCSLQDKLINVNYPVREPMARALQVQNFPLVICFKSFKMETRIQFLNVSEGIH